MFLPALHRYLVRFCLTLTYYVQTALVLMPEKGHSPAGGRGLKLVVPRTSLMFALLPLAAGSD